MLDLMAKIPGPMRLRFSAGLPPPEKKCSGCLGWGEPGWKLGHSLKKRC